MNAELTEQAEAARETGAAAGVTGAQCANETADCTHAAPAAAAVRTPGLYRSSYEHDACGIGALAHLKGQRSHAMLDDALSVLVNLEHRGGTGLERNTGDGAGGAQGRVRPPVQQHQAQGEADDQLAGRLRHLADGGGRR